ncbi:aldehyde dehydrogenase family protein [Smaragdicoccus niigatensis]|uniref:aldehyde dehydrogenase family protein n=1 Tax=Smaragdicoccus niigatensis TaxID=359359 RepID=UPI000364746D|nr:aldehyde dehydrogenase family protein [Smaragdicoccus niigatensis]
MTSTQTALLLVDLQQDFLSSPTLTPTRGELIDRATTLVDGWRRQGKPVVHVITTVARDDDRRMPHWRAAGVWRCEAGTAGHQTPDTLRPQSGEPVVHKTDFSGFGGTDLASTLEALNASAIVIAGTHLHACVRATALDAYQRRLDVTIAADAVGTDDGLHAQATKDWLAARGITFRPVDRLLTAPEVVHEATAEELPSLIAGPDEEVGTGSKQLNHAFPAQSSHVAWTVAAGDARAVDRAVSAARAAAPGWREAGGRARAAALVKVTEELAAAADSFTAAIVADVGKPVSAARAEVARTVDLLRAVSARGDDSVVAVCGPASISEDRPVGTIGVITPWNNPLAIAVGKIAPALVYGNTVLWKPSPAATRIAVMFARLTATHLPPGAISMIAGDESTAQLVMAHSGVDAVTITGGDAAGRAARLMCARRGVPLQAELGGNNAALVAADADLDAAAIEIVAGAFDFAGQRCTANRRVIVEESVLDDFDAALRRAMSHVVLGRPEEETTTVGPVIGESARARIERAISRAIRDGAIPVTGSAEPDDAALRAEGAYVRPVILRCADPRLEIVQEETFGPVLVVQPAADWAEAIDLANGVRHGLVAAAFTRSPDKQEQFLRDIRVGIVKLGSSTAGADVEAPFGGWGHSGVGPPEHGAYNRQFYTRPRAVYGLSI